MRYLCLHACWSRTTPMVDGGTACLALITIRSLRLCTPRQHAVAEVVTPPSNSALNRPNDRPGQTTRLLSPNSVSAGPVPVGQRGDQGPQEPGDHDHGDEWCPRRVGPEVDGDR